MQYTRLISKRSVRNLLPLALLLAVADVSASAVFQGLHLESVEGELKAVITVAGETQPTAFATSEPSLIVVDLPDTCLGHEFQLPQAPATGVVQGVRHAFGSDGRLRLVFDLRAPARFRIASVALDDTGETHAVYFIPATGELSAIADGAVETRLGERARERAREKDSVVETAAPKHYPLATPSCIAQQPAVIALDPAAEESPAENPPGVLLFGQQEPRALVFGQQAPRALVFGEQEPIATEPDQYEETQTGDWEFEIERLLLESGALTADDRPADNNNHLQLVAGVSRTFDNGFELRLGGRIDGHYQDGAGHSETSLKADYGESWLRYRADSWRLTAGAQKVVWGRADELSPIDRLSTPDLTRLLLDQRQARRRANPAVRFEWFSQEWSLDLVWLPQFREAELPDEESLWHPVDKRRGRIVGLPVDPVFSTLISAGRFNNDAPDDGGGGVRLRHFGQNLDYAFTLQRSRNPMPYYRLDEATREHLLTGGGLMGLEGPVIFDAVYPRSWVAGGDFGVAAGAWTFRFEGTWSSDMPVTRDNLAFDTVAAWNWVIGAEIFPGDRNFRVTLQLAGTHLEDAGDILDREAPLAFNGELETPFAQNRWRASLRFNLGLDRSDVYVNPQLIWTAWEPHEFYIGAHLFDGEEVTIGGFYAKHDMVVFGWRGRF